MIDEEKDFKEMIGKGKAISLVLGAKRIDIDKRFYHAPINF